MTYFNAHFINLLILIDKFVVAMFLTFAYFINVCVRI